MADDPISRLREALQKLIDQLTGKQRGQGTGGSPLARQNEKLRRVAIHEAGHAVVAWSMTTVAEVSSIVIVSGENGMTTWAGDRRLYVSGHPLALWERCAVCFGGIAAEAHAYGSYNKYACGEDLRQAWMTSRRLAESANLYGLTSPWGQPLDELRSDVALMFPGTIPSLQETVLLSAYCRARLVVMAVQNPLHALADEAKLRRRLNADDIERVLGPRPWAIR